MMPTRRFQGLLCSASCAILGLSLGLNLACSGLHASQNKSVGAASNAAAEAFRQQIPAPGATPALHMPMPHQKFLANGLALTSLEKSTLPLSAVTVIIKSGAAQDPAELPGLASFTAELLRMGTKQRSAAQLAEQVEARGSSIEISTSEDAIQLSTTVLSDNLNAVVDVLADMLLHPQFATPEIERLRHKQLANLEQMANDPHTSALQVFRHILYGTHPYGHLASGTPAALAKINAAHVHAFYKAHFRPSNAAIVVTGALNEVAAEAMVNSHFGSWKATDKGHSKAELARARASQAKPPTAQMNPPEIALVNRPGAPQSYVLVGELGVARDSLDYFPLTLCNAILGGQFNSRINMNLREDKGYTYGAHSSFDFWRSRGPFVVGSSVTTKVTSLALQEILKEIDTIGHNDVQAEELKNAQNRLILGLPGAFQTVNFMSGMLANLFIYDLPLDYYQKLPEHLQAVSIGDIRRVAQTYLHSDQMSLVVVGDADAVQSGLQALQRGAVQRRDALGNKITEPAAAKAAKKASK